MSNNKIARVPLHDVRQNADNPRTITNENLQRLVRSILEFPKMLQVRPVITDETGLILGGNMRHKALTAISEMDETEILAEITAQRSAKRKSTGELELLKDFWREWIKEPYVYALKEADLTEADKREFVIKDNVHAGQWDYDMLRNFDQDKLQEWCVTPWGSAFPFLAEAASTDEASGKEETKKRERVIIIFPRERREEVENLLGLPHPSKAVYNINELCHEEDEDSI